METNEENKENATVVNSSFGGESSNKDSNNSLTNNSKVDNPPPHVNGPGGDSTSSSSFGVRNRLEQTTSNYGNLPSSNPSLTTAPSINRQPRQNERRGPMNDIPVNNAVTDTMYQFQIRCLMFLVVAIVIGFMYVQIENQSIVNRKFQLVPNSYNSLLNAKSAAQQQQKVSRKTSQSSSTPEPEIPISSSTVEEESHMSTNIKGKPMIDPQYEVQAKYLSRVLKTLGDLSRKIESTDNITKPIQGIVEMKASLQEEDDTPDYMKRLGSIISDIKKSKSKNPQQPSSREKLRKPQHDYPHGEIVNKASSEQHQQQRSTGEEDEEQLKWNNFVNELVAAVSKINQENEVNNNNGHRSDSDNANKYSSRHTTTIDDDDDLGDNDYGPYSDLDSLINDEAGVVRKNGVPPEGDDGSILIKDKTYQRREDPASKQEDLLNELEMDELDFDAELDALEEEVFDGLSNNNIYYDSQKVKKDEEILTATGSGSKGGVGQQPSGPEYQISRQEKIQSRLRLLEKLLEASKEDLEAQASVEKPRLVDDDRTNTKESKETRGDEHHAASPSSPPPPQFQDEQLHVLD